MDVFDWRGFLEQYSRDLLADREIRKTAPQNVIQTKWMGFDPATAQQLAELENRLGAELPNSYTQFLRTSNGWRESGGFITSILPCEHVEWFRDKHQKWIDAYVEPGSGGPQLSVQEHCVYDSTQESHKFRLEYLQSALQISAVGDSAVYLLNPEVKTSSGEWEAWFFANWYPGAKRYQSFWDLMQADRQSFINLRDRSEQRYFPEDGIDTLRQKLPDLIQQLMEKAHLHAQGQELRKSKGRSFGEANTNGIIAALSDAKAAVKKLDLDELSPDELLGQLNELASNFETQWKANFRARSNVIDDRSGRAEGYREAAGIVRWFLNES